MPHEPAPLAVRLQAPSGHSHRSVRDRGRLLDRRDRALGLGLRGRALARALEVPDSTLRALRHPEAPAPLFPALLEVLQSEQGAAFLHVLLLALLYTFGLKGACGAGLLHTFLVQTGLSSLLASSESHLRGRLRLLRDHVGAFGDLEAAALAHCMPERKITAAVDETFFRRTMLLVAMDPVSGFLLTQRPSASRDGATWASTLRGATAGYRVKVIQVTGDAAKGLRACAEGELGVHKSEDLLHGQMPGVRGIVRALARRTQEACADRDKAREAVTACARRAREWATGPHGPGRPPNWEARGAAARQVQAQVEARVHQAQVVQDAALEAVRGLGQVLHPVALETGQPQSAEQVETRLLEKVEALWAAWEQGELGGRHMPFIEKIERLVPLWKATVAWWSAQVTEALTSLVHPPEVLALVRDVLIPAMYLHQVLARTVRGEAHEKVRTALRGMLARLAESPSWQGLSASVQGDLWALAQELAARFQRSSSCVEGQNGCLALRWHHLHRLPLSLLKALQTVHNFDRRGSDGKTAAARFFGQGHRDLFQSLCETMPPPALPRRRSPRARPDLFPELARKRRLPKTKPEPVQPGEGVPAAA